MKKYIISLALIIAFSLNASAQLLLDYKYSGVTNTKSSDDIQFSIKWTVTYEASWKLFFSDDAKLAIQRMIRNSTNGRLIVLFTNNTAEDIIAARKAGIQNAVDNPSFIDALAGAFLGAFAELFNDDINQVPEFNVKKLNIDNVSYTIPAGTIPQSEMYKYH